MMSIRIPSTAQLRKLESDWIGSCQNNWGLVLMELAGKSAAEQVLSVLEPGKGEVVIVCGRGNNGGDGLVAARYLKLWGVPVSVHMIAGPDRQASSRNESVINQAILAKLGLAVNTIDQNAIASIKDRLGRAGLIVDALLGTGIDRPVAGLVNDLIEAINRSGRPVVSIDLPSGVNSDSGQIMGTAVQADCTVTFGYLKAGLLCHPGASLCGKISLIDIGLPDLDHFQGGNAPECWLATGQLIGNWLPERPQDANKGDFGRLLVIAGSAGMSGASMLAGKSALRAGAGLTILATAKSLVTKLPAQELIYRGLAEAKEGSISAEAIAEIKPELERFSAMILGPGISTNQDTVSFVHGLLGSIHMPCVVDADALNAIAKKPDCFPGDGLNFILTPHPKELSRLIGLSVGQIQADRLEAARKAARRFNCTVILKGAHTIIASPEGKAYINPTGNSGMATAGAGDVLSGIIGGLLAQGMAPFQAAVAGVYIHGAAGDQAAGAIAEAGIVAGDIITSIPAVVSQLRSGKYPGSQLELQLLNDAEI